MGDPDPGAPPGTAPTLGAVPELPLRPVPADSIRFGATYTWRDLFWESQPFELGPGSLRYQLPYGFLDRGTETIALGETVLSPAQDYRVNYPRGVITLGGDYRMGGDFLIEVRRQPYLLSASYRLRSPQGFRAERAEPVREILPREASSILSELPANLRLVGSKTISIEGGTGRGTNLDQALKATIEGELVPGIRVNALLSDENLPIQPEGSTEELENIDKVYVEVEGRRARALFGDMSYQYSKSRFSSVQRTFQGVQGEVGTDRWNITAGAAQSKGVFETTEFRGVSGLQGPYELLDPQRAGNSVILAATARIWLDGERLTRGENHDYIMDYNSGTVTFTARRPITDDSEITVDFQSSTEAYRRSSVWAQSAGGVGNGRLDLDVLFFREGDDEGDPLSGSLTPEDRAILAAAGDDPSRAIASGVARVAPGLGEYLFVPADPLTGAPDHFVFSESDSADYLLRFTQVAPDSGDYVLDGLSGAGGRVFRFVGSGKGGYVVGRRLALPEEREVTAFVLSGRAGPGLSWWGEADLSRLDRNTLSDLDDHDNAGAAYRLGFDLSPWKGREAQPGVGALRASGSLERIGATFAPLSKLRGSFYYRDWNLEGVARRGDETVGSLDVGWEKRGVWNLSAGLETLDRPGQAAADRYQASLELGGSPERSVTVGVTDTRTEAVLDSLAFLSERRRWSGGAAFALWKLVPSVRVERERFRRGSGTAGPDSGRAYVRQVYRLSKRNPRRLSASVGFERRDTDRLGTGGAGWEKNRRLDRWDLATAYRTPTFGARIELDHRETRFFDGARKGLDRADLALAELDFTPGSGWFRSDLTYSITRRAVRSLERAVVFVGDRQGSYNEAGEEVGKNKGDYNVVFLPGDDLEPARAVEADLHLRFADRRTGPARGAWGWIRSNIAWDQYYSVLERSTTDQTTDLYLLNPRILMRDDVTVFGTNRVRHDLELLRAVPDRGLLFRFEREKTLDNRFTSGSDRRLLTKGLGRFDLALSRHWSGRLEGEVSRRSASTGRTGPGAGQVYDVLARSGTLTGGYRFNRSWRLSIDVSVLDRSDGISGSAQRLTALAPSLNATPRRGLALFADYKLTHTLSQETALGKPFFFTEAGILQTWSASVQVRLSRYILIAANYLGRHEKDLFGEFQTFHDFKLESRAVF